MNNEQQAPGQIVDAIRARQQRRRDQVLPDYVRPRFTSTYEDVETLLSLLQQPTSERCGKCGHAASVRRWHGFCQFRENDDVVSTPVCGCKCVFPTIGAGEARPNFAITELLRAALEHPESAEGYIRQAIEMLSAGAREGDIWDLLNRRRHELIGMKLGSGFVAGRDEADYNALQHVAGLVRELLTPPLPANLAATVAEGKARDAVEN